ncbi:MAG TPA: efflux RND transporter periplasmic adaptor subunit [Steroidobacteraceae bacterium]|nr:efflux RND transporter periplasmic adaptor subunit [Steroidobacteraceae bacterium]
MTNVVRSALIMCSLSALGACQGKPEPAPPVRPVQSLVIRFGTAGEPVSLSGQVQAQNQANLAFRIAGRVIERRVSLGDTVTPGELVARIESQDEKNALSGSQAALAASQATLVQARNNEERFRKLVDSGLVSRSQYDDSVQQLAAAQSRVAADSASLKTAHDNVSYTELHSDVAGYVTAKGAEPGEVVQAGQMIVQVAQKGGKDAVFNVPGNLVRSSPRNPLVTIVLAEDPSIRATGHVREVSPQADPTTGTFVVKVGLDSPPDTMRLGSTVIGSVTLSPEPVVAVPASALAQSGGKPAVWVVDPKTHQVTLRLITVQRYDTSAIIVSGGLSNGEVVVTAGVHALRPGQEVRIAS